MCRVSCVVACQNLCVQNPKKMKKNKQILLTEFTRLNQTIFFKKNLPTGSYSCADAWARKRGTSTTTNTRRTCVCSVSMCALFLNQFPVSPLKWLIGGKSSIHGGRTGINLHWPLPWRNWQNSRGGPVFLILFYFRPHLHPNGKKTMETPIPRCVDYECLCMCVSRAKTKPA